MCPCHAVCLLLCYPCCCRCCIQSRCSCYYSCRRRFLFLRLPIVFFARVTRLTISLLLLVTLLLHCCCCCWHRLLSFLLSLFFCVSVRLVVLSHPDFYFVYQYKYILYQVIVALRVYRVVHQLIFLFDLIVDYLIFPTKQVRFIMQIIQISPGKYKQITPIKISPRFTPVGYSRSCTSPYRSCRSCKPTDKHMQIMQIVQTTSRSR